MELFEFDTPNYDASVFPPPRPFQDAAHQKLREGAAAGHRCQIIMAATGAGKTYLALRIISEALKRGKSAIFVCDRTTLIEQTSVVADKYGLGAHSIMQANHWRYDHRLPFQIASVQTLARRQWPDSDVIVIDEVQSMYKGWTDHIQTVDARVIGLSATPFSKGLGKLFTNLINAATMHDLTEQGILVPMRVMSCTKINMDGAATVGGEWSDGAAAERGMEIIGDVVSEWMKHARDRKTIVFGATISHCEEMAKSFRSAGVNAAVFTCETTPEERKKLLSEYNKPDSALRVLISVEALAKGFDVPDVSAVCDCRPLRKSLSTAIQMWGRGLRSSPETGKTDCVLLDFSGNIIRFAEDFSEIYFNGLDALDMGEKLDKTIRKDEEYESKGCPKCGAIPFAKRCMSCGFEIVKPSLIENLPGEMQEIKIGKLTAAPDARSLFNQCCTYTRSHGNPETMKQRCAHLYKDIMGEWPKFSFDNAPNVPVSRAVLNKIQQKSIAYAKSKMKGAAA